MCNCEKQDKEQLERILRNEVCSGRHGCKNYAEADHPCSYRMEIDGDYDFRCNCCADCQHECAMEV